MRTPKAEAADTDWYAWGLSKGKSPVDGYDGFMYCCKTGMKIIKAQERARKEGKSVNHNVCPYHNESKRDAGVKWK